MFKEFEATIKKINQETSVLSINGREVIFPNDLLPSDIKESGSVHFSLATKKFSQVVDLLNRLLSADEDQKEWEKKNTHRPGFKFF